MAMKRVRQENGGAYSVRRLHRRPVLFGCSIILVFVGTLLFESVAAAVTTAESDVSSNFVDRSTDGGIPNNRYLKYSINRDTEEEAYDDDHHRSLWLKEFLANYLKRKPTSNPTSSPSAAVVVPVPAPSSEQPTTFMPLVPFFAPGSPSSTLKPTTSSPNIPEEEEPTTTPTSMPITKAPTPTTKPTRKPRTKSPTTKPTSSSTEEPTFEPSSSPSELPTIVSNVPTTYSVRVV